MVGANDLFNYGNDEAEGVANEYATDYYDCEDGDTMLMMTTTIMTVEALTDTLRPTKQIAHYTIHLIDSWPAQLTSLQANGVSLRRRKLYRQQHCCCRANTNMSLCLSTHILARLLPVWDMLLPLSYILCLDGT